MKHNFKIIVLGIIYLVVAACSDDSNDGDPAALKLGFSQTKSFDFSWTDVPDATDYSVTHYRIMENPDGVSGYTQIGSDIKKGVQSYKHIMPLHLRANARYILRNCTADCCVDSNAVTVSAASLKNSIGYFKTSNTGADDGFGTSVALSGDGSTLAVGAYDEASNATGTNGDQTNDSADESGAVYLY